MQVFGGEWGRGEAEKVQVFEVQVFESVPGGELEKTPPHQISDVQAKPSTQNAKI